jgi:hypothetical protein
MFFLLLKYHQVDPSEKTEEALCKYDIRQHPFIYSVVVSFSSTSDQFSFLYELHILRHLCSEFYNLHLNFLGFVFLGCLHGAGCYYFRAGKGRPSFFNRVFVFFNSF